MAKPVKSAPAPEPVVELEAVKAEKQQAKPALSPRFRLQAG